MAGEIAGSFIRVQQETATPGTYASVALASSDSITINNGLVTTNNKDNFPWRSLLEEGGIRSVTMDVSGIFDNTTTQQALIGLATSATPSDNFRMDIDSGAITMTGVFLIENFQLSGETEGAGTFTATFQSNGTIAVVITP